MIDSALHDAAVGIRKRQVRPIDLVDSCLERIRQHDSDIRAWVLVDEEAARREAETLTAEADAGKLRGPLHGIPIGIKDIIDVAGLPTEAGSPLRKGRVAEQDAPVVACLREAGAVILGKTVTVEFACFDPPPTQNPWDPQFQRTPGGSSSGSAAALAMEMCLGALGSQTGGSLVRPSSYCGVATCKPTYGRVDRTGVVPVSFQFDHIGPMARRVRDLATLLEAMSTTQDFIPRPAANSHPRLPAYPRFGVVESFFMTEAAANVRSVVESAFEKLAKHIPIETAQPTVDFEAIQEIHTTIMAVEAAAYHRGDFEAHRDSYGPMIAGLLDQGLATSSEEFADALRYLHEYRRRAPAMLRDFDALIMPATDTTAPGLETTGSKRFQCPWSCSGLPVVSLPCGLADDGMPVAVQLVARHHDDERLLQIAEWCEGQFGFQERPGLLATER
jgi:Asp-tRNA(Asn)/Glu-tRNA(Gln) amidotransferase A subunit family amidase